MARSGRGSLELQAPDLFRSGAGRGDQASARRGTSAFVGPNATRHLQHYFHNRGFDLKIDLENMVRAVPCRAVPSVVRLALKFRQAQAFLRGFSPGRYDFTSRMAHEGYDLREENVDRYFATGGYQRWGCGRAQVEGEGASRRYDVEFTYKVLDRYNWDGGKEVNLHGIRITDAFMVEFHRQGLAKEYDCHGWLRRHFLWTGDRNAPSDDLLIRSGGR